MLRSVVHLTFAALRHVACPKKLIQDGELEAGRIIHPRHALQTAGRYV